MRIAILGAGNIAQSAARLLLAQAHEVIVIDPDRARLDALAQSLDCGLIHGDGSKPAVLRDLGPERTDALLCLTSNDQTNILASLVARSLGIPRVITRIEDAELEHICIELGLEETVIPARAIGRVLFDMAEGRDVLEMTTLIRDVARVVSFVVNGADAGKRVQELELPEMSRVICFYRGGEFHIPKEETKLHEHDEVIVISHVRHLRELRERGP